MDEATSALDEETEGALYRLLQERLPHTAIISIGHRASLRQWHRRRLEIRKGGAGAGAGLGDLKSGQIEFNARLRGRHHAELGMLPAHQRLDVGNTAAAHIDLGLVMHQEFVSLHRVPPQTRFKREPL